VAHWDNSYTSHWGLPCTVSSLRLFIRSGAQRDTGAGVHWDYSGPEWHTGAIQVQGAHCDNPIQGTLVLYHSGRGLHTGTIQLQWDHLGTSEHSGTIQVDGLHWGIQILSGDTTDSGAHCIDVGGRGI
jgi:hypothetical protein